VRWPSQGMASPGTAKGFEGDFRQETADAKSVRLVRSGGAAVVFELVDEGRSLGRMHRCQEPFMASNRAKERFLTPLVPLVPHPPNEVSSSA